MNSARLTAALALLTAVAAGADRRARSDKPAVPDPSCDRQGAVIALLPDASAWRADELSAPSASQHATHGLVVGLLGSKHDFAPPAAPLGEHCAACHGRPGVPQPSSQPLANTTMLPSSAAVPASDTTVNPQVPGFDSRRGLHSTTLLCLSCHDGVIARDVGGLNNDHPAAPDWARVDWRHDHPVAVAYPRVSREYHPPARVTRAGLRLPDGRVECVTCHDPHNTWGHPGMLNLSNRRSALCLTCHIK